MQPTPSLPDPIARPIRDLLELFELELHEVSFPDVRAETLKGLADRVRERAGGVEAKKAELAEAEALLAAEKASLTQLAQRAMSYARIYAEGRPELAASLRAIELDAPEPSAPKKRGRPRKRVEPEAAEASSVLPFEDALAAE
jgi:hypothetical protein